MVLSIEIFGNFKIMYMIWLLCFTINFVDYENN